MNELDDIKDRISRLEDIIYNSAILKQEKQEKCPHHETTKDYIRDVYDEIEYEYCDNCGKKWI